MNNRAIIIGIGAREEDEKSMINTIGDADALYGALIDYCGFNKVNVKLITGSETTKLGLVNTFQGFTDFVSNETTDLLLIYFSGHGVKIGESLYLVCNDTLNNDLQNTALPGEYLLNFISKIKSDKILLLLDCCHAGGFEKKINIPFKKEDFLSGPNRVILASSSAEQLSQIADPYSVFTFSLIEGLLGKYSSSRECHITLFDLAMYVRERVHTLTKKTQSPVLDVLKNNKTSNFIIASYPNGKPTLPVKFTTLRGPKGFYAIDELVEKDESLRNEFSFLNTAIAYNNGNGNVTIVGGHVGQMIINTDSSIKELVNLLRKITEDSLSVLNNQLRAENNNKSLQLAQNLEKARSRNNYRYVQIIGLLILIGILAVFVALYVRDRLNNEDQVTEHDKLIELITKLNNASTKDSKILYLGELGAYWAKSEIDSNDIATLSSVLVSKLLYDAEIKSAVLNCIDRALTHQLPEEIKNRNKNVLYGNARNTRYGIITDSLSSITKNRLGISNYWTQRDYLNEAIRKNWEFLENSYFKGCDMTKILLYGQKGKNMNVNLDGADFRGAILDSAYLSEADLTGIIYDNNTSFYYSNIYEIKAENDLLIHIYQYYNIRSYIPKSTWEIFQKTGRFSSD